MYVWLEVEKLRTKGQQKDSKIGKNDTQQTCIRVKDREQ